MKKCIDLDEKIKQMDQEVAINPHYVQKSLGIQDDDMPSVGISGQDIGSLLLKSQDA
ncbi:COP9 signalosome complex subunit 3-like [Saccoglossus kowalevskii]